MLLALLIFLACDRQVQPSTGPGPNPVIMDTLYRMDMLHPVITQSLVSVGPGPEQIKFVEIEVTRIVNPDKYPISFTVFFEPHQGDTIRLGMVSPFPADNPGRFIVPTSGKLRSDGAILLRLDLPKEMQDHDIVAVEVKALRLLKE